MQKKGWKVTCPVSSSNHPSGQLHLVDTVMPIQVKILDNDQSFVAPSLKQQGGEISEDDYIDLDFLDFAVAFFLSKSLVRCYPSALLLLTCESSHHPSQMKSKLMGAASTMCMTDSIARRSPTWPFQATSAR